MKKLLVIGSEGFIGSNIVKHLDGKYKISKYDLKNGQDILNFEQLRQAMEGMDYVIHLAAISNIPDSVMFPIKTYKTNVVGTANVIELATEYNIKVVFPSSAAIHYPTSSPYAYTKLINETQFNESSCRFTVLRLYNVYGNGSISVVPKFINLIKNGETIDVYGDGKRIRDYIFIDDICRAFELALDDKSNGKVIEIGTGIGTDINEVIQLIEKVLDKNALVTHTDSRGFDPPESLACIDDAKEILGFTAEVALDEGIKILGA